MCVYASLSRAAHSNGYNAEGARQEGLDLFVQLRISLVDTVLRLSPMVATLQFTDGDVMNIIERNESTCA